MLPPFDVQGGAALVAARAAAVIPLLSAFGTVTFRVAVLPRFTGRMPPSLAHAVQRRLLWLAQLSLAAAVLGCLLWLVVQAATIADAETPRQLLAAVPAVLRKTKFGQVMTLQLAGIGLSAALLGGRDATRRQRAALAALTLAVALQAGHSHAFSMVEGPSLLLACDIVHLWAAGAWLGGLLPLLLIVRISPPPIGAHAARWFSPLGQACLWALLLTAAYQGWILVATVPGLIGTAYGWLATLKTALFGILFGFAWFNRYCFAPALLRGEPEPARKILLRSIALQTGFGLLILAAASLLSELPPAMHGQPIWPFGERISFAAINEDADFRTEVIAAALAITAAVAALLAALVARRWRLPALAVAGIVTRFAAPHFDVLLVTAYPSSYFHSPTGFTADSITAGQAAFAQNCVTCHGAGGAGDGPAAKSLPLPPANLTALHLWAHSDGELFWWISHGMQTPEGGQAMPGFAATLDEDTRWALIDYIRAHNAGTAYHATGAWPHLLMAPDFGLTCGAASSQLSDMRGQFLRLVIGQFPPAASSVRTIIAGPPSGATPPGLCVAQDETVPPAYAIAAGLPQAALQGAQFLIDPQGVLREAAAAPGWDAPALAAEIARLRVTKVAPADVAMPMNMNMKM